MLAEVKHGDDALTGNAGLHAHVRDLNEFLASADDVRELKDDMVQVFNQKRALGLVDCGKDLVSFSEEPPLYLLLLANHDPESTTLDRELDSMPPSPHAEVRVMRASMLGYGLYDDA